MVAVRRGCMEPWNKLWYERRTRGRHYWNEHMKITILSTSSTHPVNEWIGAWMRKHGAQHSIDLVRSRKELSKGDVLFLVSCGEIVTSKDRAPYEHTFVLHASDLPKGRGWNPHIWAVVNGETEVTVSILEAEDRVDTGAIWGQLVVPIPKHFLWDEINKAVFDAEFALMDLVVTGIDTIEPRLQATDIEPTYHRLRTPLDGRLDPKKSIADQFDLMRVSDPERYPAFIEMDGYKFTLRLERVGPVDKT